MEQKQVVRFILLAVGVFVVFYLMYESWWYFRQHAYDKQIRVVANQYGVSPYLVKAVVWRESKFNRLTLGSAGEIGLMQVMSGAAKEWAQALFKSNINLEAGTWYLARALQRWKDCDDPVPFALAEYNAGRSNAVKWMQKCKSPKSSNEFIRNIGIASTRRYVQDVTAIEKKLERRGRL
jgi:peptidoglycan lytic transglycosylase